MPGQLAFFLENVFVAVLVVVIWLHQEDGFPGGASGKEPSCQCRRCYRLDSTLPWVRKIPWSTTRQSTPAFLPGESHRQRSLVCYGPYGGKKSETVEATSHACVHRKGKTSLSFLMGEL